MDAALDDQGRLWVGTESAGVYVLDGDKVTRHRAGGSLPSDVVYGLLPSRDGAMWVATAEGAVRFYGGGGADPCGGRGRLAEGAGVPPSRTAGR